MTHYINPTQAYRSMPQSDPSLHNSSLVYGARGQRATVLRHAHPHWAWRYIPYQLSLSSSVCLFLISYLSLRAWYAIERMLLQLEALLRFARAFTEHLNPLGNFHTV